MISIQHTGVPLRGGKRVQFNMFLRKVDSIALTKRLRTTLFPIVWVDEGIELNDKMVQMINSELINVLFYLDLFQWAAIGLGTVIMLVSLLWFIVKKKKVRSQSVEPIFTINKWPWSSWIIMGGNVGMGKITFLTLCQYIKIWNIFYFTLGYWNLTFSIYKITNFDKWAIVCKCFCVKTLEQI